MKILVTGANGLLGKSLTKYLSQNHQVFATTRSKTISAKESNIYTIVEDLTNFNPDTFPKSIDAVFYLAQSKKFRDFPKGALDVFDVNIAAPIKIINWAIKNKVKHFIYASTGGVYPNKKDKVKESDLIDLNENYNIYTASKISAEILLTQFSSYFSSLIIARPFFIYGEGQEESMLIPRLINNVLKGNPITISDTEGISINPIHVNDTAIAFKNMLRLEGKHVINIAGNEIVSLKRIGEIIGEIANKQPVFNYNNKTQNDLIADNTLMLKLLHNPTISLIQGLKETYEYILQNSVQEV